MKIKQFIDKIFASPFWLHFVSIIISIVFFFLLDIWTKYVKDKENREYKKIVNIHSKIDGYVVDYSWSNSYKGTRLATLSTGEKLFVTSKYDLIDFLEKGDHLYKSANSDTLIVTTINGRKNIFIVW